MTCHIPSCQPASAFTGTNPLPFWFCDVVYSELKLGILWDVGLTADADHAICSGSDLVPTIP